MRNILAIGAAALSLAVATTDALASEGGAPGDAHFVPMADLNVPIVDGAHADGTLRVKLVLQMAQAGDDDSALPPLRSAALGTALEFARLYASPMAPVNATQLASDMTAALHRQDARVARVLIVEVGASRG